MIILSISFPPFGFSEFPLKRGTAILFNFSILRDRVFHSFLLFLLPFPPGLTIILVRFAKVSKTFQGGSPFSENFLGKSAKGLTRNLKRLAFPFVDLFLSFKRREEGCSGSRKSPPLVVLRNPPLPVSSPSTDGSSCTLEAILFRRRLVTWLYCRGRPTPMHSFRPLISPNPGPQSGFLPPCANGVSLCFIPLFWTESEKRLHPPCTKTYIPPIVSVINDKEKKNPPTFPFFHFPFQ